MSDTNTRAVMGDNNLEITPNLVRSLISYDQFTGLLTWKVRDEDMFTTRRGHSIWNARYAGSPALNCDDGKGYRHGKIFRKHMFSHRAAWMIAHDEMPPAQIDHINGDKSDNRIQNLRAVTNAENGQNAKRSASNKSGVTGVCWVKRKGKFLAYIGSMESRVYLGTFPDLASAVAARRAAEAAHGYHENHGREK